MFGVSPLTPAYGRDYKSLKALESDFNDLKDFKTPDGQAINKTDLLGLKMTTIRVRWANIQKTAVIQIKKWAKRKNYIY